MAKRDLRDIKEEVRSRADIVQIIGGYTRLKPAGKNFMGLCPFHADKTPSFSVSPMFQSYRCWSCGEKGDVFTFLEKKESLSFMEALEKLAGQVGVTFERSGLSPERVSEREEMRELNSVAVAYFRDRATRSEDARQYLTGRGILKETQDRFDIGFAPPDWDGLATHLQRRRANIPLAVKMGLLRERKEAQGYVDYYRNRVMFPIHDRSGNVAGFGGRALGDEQPKYINSPQSDVFNKSGLLYGLYFARQTFSAGAPPVFVEGYTDVVTTHQAGFTQCVATLGTAMTEEHARMLVNYNHTVILCYDSDSAGINATLKGATIWEDMKVDGARLLVARLPSGEDPDSLLKRGDTAVFQLALDNAVACVDFEIELVMRRNNTAVDQGRDQALNEIIPILATIRGSTNLDRYAQKFAMLHPMYNFNPSRAVESILVDVSAYQKSTKGRSSGRSSGYDSVETQNGQPLRETAQPPNFYSAKQPRGFDPKTKNWVQPGQRNFQKAGYSKGGRFEDATPASDRTPPNLNLPALTAAEKAECILLRAMFVGQWRRFIVSHIEADMFVTDCGRELIGWILKAPTDEDGDIHPVSVIRLIEQELDIEEDPFQSSTPQAEDVLQFERNLPNTGNQSAKLSQYIRDVLEDSATVLSNEPINEATLLGCIRRLHERRHNLEIRELREMVTRTDLTMQQLKDYNDRLRELVRAKGGHASGS